MGALKDPTVVIDARNDYEYELAFRGAIKPEIKILESYLGFVKIRKSSSKKIITYCGGVRCEKFSGWLKREGFEELATPWWYSYLWNK